MESLEEKQYHLGKDYISYYSFRTPSNKPFILFIHGLGLDKEWFPLHFQTYSLSDFSWIVPDLIGFGKSSKPRKLGAYSMTQQAKNILSLLQSESITEVIVLAHSLGGPIAVSLLEQIISSTKIKVISLFYLEGNIDENDAFLSSKVAELDYPSFDSEFSAFLERFPPSMIKSFEKAGSFPIWASSFDVVRASKENTLLDRILQLGTFPKYFIYGEQNKGRFTSELLITKHKQMLIFIPKAGHIMYEDNSIVFWQVIREGILRALK